MKSNTDSWLRGYACAVATLAEIEGGIDVRVSELMAAGGLTEDECKKAEVDSYDMERLFPLKRSSEQ